MFTDDDQARYQAALVRFYRNGIIVGAGILVAEQYVLTCAHVLTRTATAPETVSLDFPFKAAAQKLTGTVVYWKPERDLAGVRLLDAAPAGTHPLPFRPSSNYINGSFRVYGFPEKQPVGGWALGNIIGGATEDLVQIQGETEQGYAIEPGFSGAPVWDVGRGEVIGLARLRDKDRPLAKIGYLIPYRQLIEGLKIGESVSLGTLLETYSNDIETASLEGAYRVCRPEGSLDPIPEDLPGKLEALARMKDLAGYSALVRFTACLTLSEFSVLLELRLKLRQWLSRRDVNVDEVLAAIAPQLQNYQAQISRTASPHLLIWLNAHNSGDTYPVEALFIPDRCQYDPTIPRGFEPIPAMAEYDTPIPLSRLPEVLRDCLADCTNLCSNLDLTTLTIELFLPFPVLHQTLEWEAAYEMDDLMTFLEPEPIAIRYRFIVRSSERLLKQYERAQCRAFWENKWQELEQLLHAKAGETLLLASDQTPLKQLQVELKAPDKVGLKLLNCPTQVQTGNPLKALLSSGSPAAIWLRQAPAQVDFPTAFETFLGCCLETLTESVQQARQAAFPLEKDAHIGHHLSLVWEDPHLVPPFSKGLAS